MGVRGGERIAVGCNGEKGGGDRGWSGGTPAGSAWQPACSKAQIKAGEGAGLDGRWRGWWWSEMSSSPQPARLLQQGLVPR